MSDDANLSRRQMLRGGLFGKQAPEEKDAAAQQDETCAPASSPADDHRPAPQNPKIAGPADATPPPGSTAGPAGDPSLPELHQSIIDNETVVCLFRDIAACTQVIEVLPRYASQQLIEDRSVSLDQGRQLLMEGQARAVQIRYRYDGAEWWDTLIRQPNGVKIVRIRHDFGPSREDER